MDSNVSKEISAAFDFNHSDETSNSTQRVIFLEELSK